MIEYIYFIIKVGEKYEHGVHGIFNTEAAAIEGAKKLAADDVDNYHVWMVHKVPLNQVVYDYECVFSKRKGEQ